MIPLHTPILIITYKRLDTLEKVLESVSKVRPSKLYVANNGPNPENPEDEVKVSAVRALFNVSMPWPCEVVTLFRDQHLSAKESISSSIKWFFDLEEEGIILEDDCVVDNSFYYFAQECLERYRFDDKITQISASNFQDEIIRGEASYYFSRYNHIWGWAGWRRSWKYFDLNLQSISKEKSIQNIKALFTRKQDVTYWNYIYNYVKSGNIDTWDYQWMFCMWNQGGRTIIPQVNTVVNIGAGKDATNTINQSERITSIKSHTIAFPLVHPENTDYNTEADNYTSDNLFMISKSYSSGHLKIIVSTFLPVSLKKKIKKFFL